MLLSIITINLNNAAGLKRTVESVVDQTYQEFEYLVIDGGSTDASIDVIKQFDKRIDHWITEKDNGIYDAMNKGIAFANGQYIYFLNGGDILHDKSVLQDLVVAIKENNFPDIIFGNLSFRGNESVVQNRKNCDIVDLFFKPINHQTIIAKRQLFVDKFDTRFKLLADYNWFMSQLVRTDTKILYADRIICYYDVTGLSAKSRELLKAELQKVRDQYFRKSYGWLLSQMKGTRFMYLLKAKTIKSFFNRNILKEGIDRESIANV